MSSRTRQALDRDVCELTSSPKAESKARTAADPDRISQTKPMAFDPRSGPQGQRPRSPVRRTKLAALALLVLFLLIVVRGVEGGNKRNSHHSATTPRFGQTLTTR